MNINEIRQEMSSLNDEMLKLFIRHMELTAQLGDAKKAEGKLLYDRKAEEEILEKAVENSPQDMQNYSIEFFRKLMDLSKEYYSER